MLYFRTTNFVCLMKMKNTTNHNRLWLMLGINALLISGIEVSFIMRCMLFVLILCIALDQMIRHFKKDREKDENNTESNTKQRMALGFMAFSVLIGAFMFIKVYV